MLALGLMFVLLGAWGGARLWRGDVAPSQRYAGGARALLPTTLFIGFGLPAIALSAVTHPSSAVAAIADVCVLLSVFWLAIAAMVMATGRPRWAIPPQMRDVSRWPILPPARGRTRIRRAPEPEVFDVEVEDPELTPRRPGY